MFKINSNIFKIGILLIVIVFVLMIPLSIAQAASQKQEGAPPVFNLLEFLKTAGIFYFPTLAIVFGIVDYLGKWGIKDRWQFASSLISGLILGSLIMYFTTYPETAVAWFSVALYGLLIGLGASGCYNGIVKASTKGAEKVLSAGGIIEPPQ